MSLALALVANSGNDQICVQESVPFQKCNKKGCMSIAYLCTAPVAENQWPCDKTLQLRSRGWKKAGKNAQGTALWHCGLHETPNIALMTNAANHLDCVACEQVAKSSRAAMANIHQDNGTALALTWSNVPPPLPGCVCSKSFIASLILLIRGVSSDFSTI